MPPTEGIDDLRQKLAHAEAVIAELRSVVADLRQQIDAQQAHIHRLVRMTFGWSSDSWRDLRAAVMWGDRRDICGRISP